MTVSGPTLAKSQHRIKFFLHCTARGRAETREAATMCGQAQGMPMRAAVLAAALVAAAVGAAPQHAARANGRSKPTTHPQDSF